MQAKIGIDPDHLRGWIGRSEAATDFVTARLVQGLRATLGLDPGQPVAGDPAPAGVHWCYLLSLLPRSDDFLPPVPLQQRLWAGGKTEFVSPLRVGEPVTRQSTITDIQFKSGRSGDLCFVTVRHVYATPAGPATIDEQHFVYRDPPGTPRPASGIALAAWRSKAMLADPVMLFRYSALTCNGFRVHYDAAFARDSEGYPGLMVHGPLQASLLLEYAAELRGGRRPTRFAHRSIGPLFEGPFTLNAREDDLGLTLWVANAAGDLCLTASADWTAS